MKIGRLSRATNFWRSFSFVGNTSKMRKALIAYLQDEGLKCDLSDGNVLFEYNDSLFVAAFASEEDYAECTILYRCTDEDYEKLDLADKTFMADKVNTDMENHATVLAYNDSFHVSTSFYFTDRTMMINLFSQHFEELTDSLSEALDIVGSKLDDQRPSQSRSIGFGADAYKPSTAESTDGQAVAKA